MSLAQTFSESVRESMVRPPASPVDALRAVPFGTAVRRSRARSVIAGGLTVGLELAFFLGVGGMMAAGALLLR